MRILFLSTTFPDATATSRGTYNSALCRALAVEHQVQAIAPRGFPEVIRQRLKGRTFQPANEIHQAGIETAFPTYWYTPKYRQHRYGEQMWRSVKKAVQHSIKTIRPDAVLSYWAHPEGEVGIRIGQLAGIPSAVIVGGSDVLLLPKLPKRGPIVRDVLLQSDAVITVSDGLKRACEDLGASSEKVHTIYQGIEPQVFNQSTSREQARQQLKLNSDVAHLLWVGRMVPVKALPTLIETMHILRKRTVAFQLNLLGDGPDKASIQTQVQQLGLDAHVHFAGPVGHDQIANWYRAADVTVMSSDSEGLPNVLRESLACGTPFACTDVGSINEITDERFSCLAEKGNSTSLANAIQAMLTAQAKQEAGKYRARTWTDCARETTELLEQLQSSSFQINRKKIDHLPSVLTNNK